jgi:hypothetical protein
MLFRLLAGHNKMNLSLESQYTPCPKCHYTRKTTDYGSDNQCPACGVVYEKYIQHQSYIQHPENSQANHVRQTFHAILSNWEKFKLAVCLTPFFAIVAVLTQIDSILVSFHKPLSEWLVVLALSAWLAYRIQNALNSGTLYTRGRYEFKGHWYERESQPYMFWQTIIAWLLGIFLLWVILAYTEFWAIS